MVNKRPGHIFLIIFVLKENGRISFFFQFVRQLIKKRVLKYEIVQYSDLDSK